MRSAAKPGRRTGCSSASGETDSVLVAVAASMDDFEALTRPPFVDDPNVRRVRTPVVMGRAERSLVVPARTAQSIDPGH